MAEVGEKVTDRHREVLEIFRQSYFISQGFPKLHDHLFQWLASEKFLELQDVETTPKDWLKGLYAPKTHSTIGQKNDGNHGDPLTRWIELQKVLRKTEPYEVPPSQDSLLNSIFTELVNADLFFQIKGREGREHKKDMEVDGPHDIHKSFLRHYALSENFKKPPFQQFFMELRPLLVNYNDDSKRPSNAYLPSEYSSLMSDFKKHLLLGWVSEQKLENKISLLVKLWEENHPGHKFFGQQQINP